MRSSIIPLALIATIAFAIPIASFAAGSGAPPLLVPYSGTLELNGTPATGIFTMSFGLFDGDESDGAATQLWTNTRDIEVATGQFSVTLGTDSSIPVAAAQAQSLFVQIDVEGTPLGGRQRVTPSLQAVRAASATTFDVTGALTAGSVGATTVTADTVNAVTMNADTVNAPTVIGGDVLANLVSGNQIAGTTVTSDNVVQNGAEAGFDFAGDHSGSGYVRIGSLQIAWGKLSKNFTPGDHQIGYPAAFAANPTVNVSLQDPGFGGAAATSGIGARNINRNNFNALFKGSGGNNVVEWMAIGRWR